MSGGARIQVRAVSLLSFPPHVHEREDACDSLHSGVRSHHTDRQPSGQQRERGTAVAREGSVGLEPF